MQRSRRVGDPARRTRHKTKLARELRANATDAERKLWAFLRRKQMAGLRFRRQHPVGPFIADFYCSAAKLIIELDGEPRNVAYDIARGKWLNAHGYFVLRFDNVDVLKGEESVLEGILRAVVQCGAQLPKQALHIPPSP